MKFCEYEVVDEFINKLVNCKTMNRGKLDRNRWWTNIIIELDKLRFEEALLVNDEVKK